MVFFVCSSCGQSIKKNQVEKHYMRQCRNCDYLTCMDCNKDFWGNDYMNHTQCITEDQKYGGKDYVPKASDNKGAVKQEMWIEKLKSNITNAKVSPVVASHIRNLLQYPNIPRKKIKFENFVRNSLNLRNQDVMNEVWEVFSMSLNSNDQNSKNDANGEVPTSTSVCEMNQDGSNSKRKCLDGDQNSGISECKKQKVQVPDESQSLNGSNKKFKWTKSIKTILREVPEKVLSIKKLKKKVLKAYTLHHGESEDFETEFVTKLEEKLKKCKNVEVVDKLVKLNE